MGGRGLLVGNEVFCLFVALRHARKRKERILRLLVFVRLFIYSFIHSKHSIIQNGIFF